MASVPMAVAADAATASLEQLERPSGLSQISVSPSGTRLAALFKGRESESDLVVLEPRDGKLVPVMSTRLHAQQAIASYAWLSDDYLAIYYESPDQDFDRFSIANLSRRSLDVQDTFTRIVKAPWGDADHVLLSATGNNCNSATASRCLMTLDLHGGSRDRISEPLALLAVDFLVVSPTEIYASGRDAHGMQQDFRLDVGTHAWRPVADGTVQRRRAALGQAARALPEDVLEQEAGADMRGAMPVWTTPDHHLVGLVGHAPQRAFLALDPRLKGLQALLEQQFPDQRVALSGLNQTLTRGMVQIWGPDQPPRYLLFNDAGGLTEYPLLAPHISPAMLGKTLIERDWAPGMPVAMTLPPQGVALIGAVVEPFVAPAGVAEDPLEVYDATRQAFAQAGIAVVRALTVMPAAFPSNAAGGEWRQMQAARLQHVIEHASELVRGKPICLMGNGPNGALALEWSGLAHVGCVVSVGARLDSQAFGERVQMFDLQSTGRVSRVHIANGQVMATPAMPAVNFSISTALLHREVPALFGVPGSEALADPAQWAATLPPKVMLAYDMRSRIEIQYAAESARFRAAARTDGKNLTYYADTTSQEEVLSHLRLARAMIDYVRGYFGAAAVAAAH
jgi:hypothetical protein